MTGWTPVKTTGWDVSGWRWSEGGLGHWRPLHRTSWRRRGCGGVVVDAGGTWGALVEARLRLREGQFGQSVGR